MFHFEASPGLSRNVEIYGTLPRKKKGRSVNATPVKPGVSPQKSASQSFQDPVRSSVRRAEGFSRLLEFTRQQQEEMEACRLPTFDVTQSMPVCANTALCDIEENEGEIQSGISETEEDVCLLGTSQTPGAEALCDDADLCNAEESEGEIQSGLPEMKDEVCLLGTSEIQGAKALGSYQYCPTKIFECHLDLPIQAALYGRFPWEPVQLATYRVSSRNLI